MSKQTNYRVNRNELASLFEKFKVENDSKAKNAGINSIFDSVVFIERELEFWKERAQHYAQVADESFNIWQYKYSMDQEEFKEFMAAQTDAIEVAKWLLGEKLGYDPREEFVKTWILENGQDFRNNWETYKAVWYAKKGSQG